jgi:putative oxidoreductase
MAPHSPVPPPVRPPRPSRRSRPMHGSTIQTASGAIPSGRSGAMRFAVPILRWALVVVFVGAATMKLTSQPETVGLFRAVGLGQWFRFAVGSCELIGAALLAYSRTTVIGAVGLSALMLGAVGTEVMILDRVPVSSGTTLVALVVLAALASRHAEGDASVAPASPPNTPR